VHDDGGLLAEQRAYYDARAPEYDEWWQRRGRFDAGPESAGEWGREVARVEAALEAFEATGNVLELAGGTGWWTSRLARTAARLTVVDSSRESLELSRERVHRPDVEYLVADLFAWRPRTAYDVVFFSFWLSHVPRSRFSAFWSLVRSCLAPAGRVFLIDNRREQPGPNVIRRDADLELRRVDDGREFRVIEVFYEPEELEALLGEEGWTARVEGTRGFVFGDARPAR
jgi:demethylmenaquinone methyltransferase/2-methoxy-6-polyprenyl-1,4-benzoquinol methylase